MRRTFSNLVLVAVAGMVALTLGGCRRPAREAPAAAAAPSAPASEATPASTWKPPADGCLIARQIEAFLAVKQRGRENRLRVLAEKKSALKPAGERDAGKPGDPLGAPSAFASLEAIHAADAQAILELGYDRGELDWVAQRILEAQVAVAQQKIEARLATGRQQYIGLLEVEKARSTDDARRADLDAQIADFKHRTRRAGAKLPDAVRKNCALLAPYQARLDAQLGPEERFAILSGKGTPKAWKF